MRRVSKKARVLVFCGSCCKIKLPLSQRRTTIGFPVRFVFLCWGIVYSSSFSLATKTNFPLIIRFSHFTILPGGNAQFSSLGSYPSVDNTLKIKSAIIFPLVGRKTSVPSSSKGIYKILVSKTITSDMNYFASNVINNY